MAHLDEGTIHAWLDDALSPEAAARVEAHVAGCAECSAAVAEARGLMAAASRIVGALDRVPGGVIPPSLQAPARADLGTPAGPPRGVRWTGWPLRAAAAMLLMVGGAVVVLRDGRVQQEVRFAPVADQTTEAEAGPSDAGQAATAPASAAAQPEVTGRAASSAAAPDATAPTTPPSAPAIRPAPVSGGSDGPPTAASPRAYGSQNAPRVATGSAAEPTSKRAIEPPAPLEPPPVALRAAPPPVAVPRTQPPAGSPAAAPLADERPESPPADHIRLRAASPIPSTEAQRQRAPLQGKVAENRMALAPSTAAGEVRGVVRSADGGPLPGVQVSVQGTMAVASTEPDGRFALTDVPAGRQELRVRRIGFEPTTVAVTVRPDTAAELEVALTPSTTTLSQVVVTGVATPAAGCYVLTPAIMGAGTPRGATSDTLVLLDQPLDDADGWRRARLAPGNSAARWRQEEDGALLVTWSDASARLELRGATSDPVRVGHWAPAGARTAREVRARRVECGEQEK